MEAAEERIVESTRQIYRLYHDGVNVEEAVELMRGQDILSGMVEFIYDQLSWNEEKLITERFNYYSTKHGINNSFDCVKFWTSRYLLSHPARSYNPAFHEIDIIDLFNNKLINVTINKSAEQFAIHYLKDGFGLLEEHKYTAHFIILIFLDFRLRKFKKIHTVKSGSYSDILVNKADPVAFLLKGSRNNALKIGKIIDKKIIFDEEIEIGFNPDSFYDKCVYGLNRRNGNRRDLEKLQLYIYDAEKKTENHSDLEAPTGYRLNRENVTWMCNNLFIDLISPNKTHFIGRLNVQTRQWNVLDFSLKLSSYRMTGFKEGSLVVYAKSKHYSEHHFYKIQFGNPDLLENMTWLSLVKAMKTLDTVNDPYEAARKYLPSNSAINCPFKR